MKKVLLTGASGFIGQHCIAPLKALGYEVHCVSTHAVSESEKNVYWHKANLLSALDIKALLDNVKPDELLHLAWYVEPGKVINHPCNMEWVEKTLNMIRLFREQGGKRVVIAGSCYEYNWDYAYCSEMHTPRNANTVYGIAKNSLYEIFRIYCEQTGLSGAWGRVFFLYGPYENPNRLVSSVIRSLLKGEKAKSSHGLQIRDYMHVQDVADGLVKLLDSDLNEDYNIATGQPITLKEILLEIADIMDARELLDIGAIPARANDTPLVVADVRKFNDVTNWVPSFDLRSGLEHTIDWWKNNIKYKQD